MIDNRIAEAKRLGREAFSLGISAPALDAKMMVMLTGSQVGESTSLLRAWMKGWASANLEQVID